MPARARMRSTRRRTRTRLVRRTGSLDSSSRRERLVTVPPFDYRRTDQIRAIPAGTKVRRPRPVAPATLLALAPGRGFVFGGMPQLFRALPAPLALLPCL